MFGFLLPTKTPPQFGKRPHFFRILFSEPFPKCYMVFINIWRDFSIRCILVTLWVPIIAQKCTSHTLAARGRFGNLGINFVPTKLQVRTWERQLPGNLSSHEWLCLVHAAATLPTVNAHKRRDMGSARPPELNARYQIWNLEFFSLKEKARAKKHD